MPELDEAEDAAVREWLRRPHAQARRLRTPPRQRIRPSSAWQHEQPPTPERDSPEGDAQVRYEEPMRCGGRSLLQRGRRAAKRAHVKVRTAARAYGGGRRNTGLLWRRLCSAIPRGHGQLQSTLLRRLRLPLAAFKQLVEIRDQHGGRFFGLATYGGSPSVYRPAAGEDLPQLEQAIFRDSAPQSIFAPR